MLLARSELSTPSAPSTSHLSSFSPSAHTFPVLPTQEAHSASSPPSSHTASASPSCSHQRPKQLPYSQSAHSTSLIFSDLRSLYTFLSPIMACRPFHVSLILIIVYNDNKCYDYITVARYHTGSTDIKSASPRPAANTPKPMPPQVASRLCISTRTLVCN